MSSDSNTIDNTLQDVGNDVRNRLSDIASTVLAGKGGHQKDAEYNTLE
jgi:hypothetical protein